MTIPVVLGVLALIAIYGGIKGYSITGLIFGEKVPRTPPTSVTVDSSATSNPSPGGSGGTTQSKGYSSPITRVAKFERVDQGVDYEQSTPYLALGTGTVIDIARGWAGGTGKAVYVKLNKPIVMGGRKYDGYYVAETNPLVKKGDRVQAGQAISSGGAAELGFLINGYPTPLQGGLGAGTKPTQAGNDFRSFVDSLLGRK